MGARSRTRRYNAPPDMHSYRRLLFTRKRVVQRLGAQRAASASAAALSFRRSRANPSRGASSRPRAPSRRAMHRCGQPREAEGAAGPSTSPSFGIAFISGSGGSSRASISRTLTSDLSLNDTRRPFFLAEGARPPRSRAQNNNVEVRRRLHEASVTKGFEGGAAVGRRMVPARVEGAQSF